MHTTGACLPAQARAAHRWRPLWLQQNRERPQGKTLVCKVQFPGCSEDPALGSRLCCTAGGGAGSQRHRGAARTGQVPQPAQQDPALPSLRAGAPSRRARLASRAALSMHTPPLLQPASLLVTPVLHTPRLAVLHPWLPAGEHKHAETVHACAALPCCNCPHATVTAATHSPFLFRPFLPHFALW